MIRLREGIMQQNYRFHSFFWFPFRCKIRYFVRIWLWPKFFGILFEVYLANFSWNLYWTWKDQDLNQGEIFDAFQIVGLPTTQATPSKLCREPALKWCQCAHLAPSWRSNGSSSTCFHVLTRFKHSFPFITLSLGCETSPIYIELFIVF